MAIDLTGEPAGVEVDRQELVIPQRNLVADDVYEVLRDGLRAGRFPAGARLNLDHLARELHVSNTPVRTALARLQADGLVTKEPYRGYAVSKLLDSRNTSEVYEFRLILEPALASNAAGKAVLPGSDVTEIKELCASHIVDRLIAEGDAEQLGKRDYLFHIALARLSGNNLATESLTHALARMPGYTARDRNNISALAWEEHQRIVAAVLAGDSDASGAAMRDHLRGAYERMRTIV